MTAIEICKTYGSAVSPISACFSRPGAAQFPRCMAMSPATRLSGKLLRRGYCKVPRDKSVRSGCFLPLYIHIGVSAGARHRQYIILVVPTSDLSLHTYTQPPRGRWGPASTNSFDSPGPATHSSQQLLGPTGVQISGKRAHFSTHFPYFLRLIYQARASLPITGGRFPQILDLFQCLKIGVPIGCLGDTPVLN